MSTERITASVLELAKACRETAEALGHVIVAMQMLEPKALAKVQRG